MLRIALLFLAHILPMHYIVATAVGNLTHTQPPHNIAYHFGAFLLSRSRYSAILARI